MGSAVVTAQDYYDVSDTEAGSDDFAVRWGEKKMDAGHRWTLWTGPGPEERECQKRMSDDRKPHRMSDRMPE